jgi:ATP-binding cassette subfamily F protein 3
MAIIVGEKITHNYGKQTVLKDISLQVQPTDRIGLIGPNGEGKTTLLRIIVAEIDPTLGNVHRAKGLRVGYLPQDPPALDETTVHGAMLRAFADVRRMEKELETLAHEMARRPADKELLDRYGVLETRFAASGGYEYATRISQVLAGLKFEPETWDRPLSKLSGGQRTRAHLGTLLLDNPDVLMLDEPTNHLDMDSVEWLESWLDGFHGAIVVVSHDRYFLDRVTTATWEVAWQGLEAYRGSYSAYLTQRAERDKTLLRRWKEQQEFIEKTEDFIRQHIAGQRSKEARGRRTRLERFMKEEAVDKPRVHEKIDLTLEAAKRTGDLVLRAEDVSVGWAADKPLLWSERLEVWRGQRIAIVGPNGIGKTTLVRTLLGEMQPLGGKVTRGANVEFGYLSQTHDQFDPDQTALDAVLEAAKGVSAEEARSLLGSLLLSGEDVFKTIGQLSGGQRSRVVLARLAVQSANVLMLDEPTNHLDIPSTEIMQQVLVDYDGTILFVSHDRYLVQAVATDIWAIDDGEVRAVAGGWGDYLAWRTARREQAAREAGRPARKEDRKAEYEQARKETSEVRRLARRHSNVEKRIDAAEKELARINDDISAAGVAGDVARVQRLSREYSEKDKALKGLWAEWEDLGQQVEDARRQQG